LHKQPAAAKPTGHDWPPRGRNGGDGFGAVWGRIAVLFGHRRDNRSAFDLFSVIHVQPLAHATHPEALADQLVSKVGYNIVGWIAGVVQDRTSRFSLRPRARFCVPALMDALSFAVRHCVYESAMITLHFREQGLDPPTREARAELDVARGRPLGTLGDTHPKVPQRGLASSLSRLDKFVAPAPPASGGTSSNEVRASIIKALCLDPIRADPRLR
jgi:hypothetical protein